MEESMVAERITERFHNHSGLIDVSILTNSRFIIIGAGAIGSFVAMTLAKMGAMKLLVFDNDKIEEHNIANQMYPEYMVGTPKVDALKEVVRSYSGVEIEQRNTKWDNSIAIAKDNNPTFVISAVDNMDVRKDIFEWAKAQGADYLIDGRMGALLLRTYSVNLKDQREIEFYCRTLYPQSKALPDRCTMKSIIFTVLLVAGHMLNMLSKRINKEEGPIEIIHDSKNNRTMYTKTHMEVPEVETHEQE